MFKVFKVKDSKEGDVLAKHSIKKGKVISSNDLCYISAKTGDITDIKEFKDNSVPSFFGSSSSFTGDIDKEYQTYFDTEINNIVGKCAKKDIVEYEAIDSKILESVLEKQNREDKKKKQEEDANLKAKIEATKKIIEQKRQQSSVGKEAKPTDTNKIDDDTIKNEAEENIWC